MTGVGDDERENSQSSRTYLLSVGVALSAVVVWVISTLGVSKVFAQL